MTGAADKLRHDARDIWQAGLDSVRSEPLVRRNVRVEGRMLHVGATKFDLDRIGRIVVVGAGKAGAGMAAGIEAALGDQISVEKKLAGWVHVPANCVRPLAHIHLHPARPAAANEPTAEGVAGAQQMMRLVSELSANDLCIVLISGGGSALLPLPADGVTLEDKLAVTRLLSAGGATIDELNTVRTQLSRIKGGGLARACRAGQLVTLVISDVLGDPLDLIASGPTVESRATPHDARAILERYDARPKGIAQSVFDALDRHSACPPIRCRVSNVVIGNNAVAVVAAAQRAEQLGYTPAIESAPRSEGAAEDVGRRLAEVALGMRGSKGPDCFISGGEPTVTLVDVAQRGLGGRNQQLVLAAVDKLQADGARGMIILSGGTDGEDGPTDAAGAWADELAIAEATRLRLDAADYLARDDAYHWFEQTGALIKTGPTDTNVCDLRVVLVQSDL